MKYLITICFITLFSANVNAQDYSRQELDSIKYAVTHLQMEVNEVRSNLIEAKRSLKTGVFIATLGYTVTIIGGQLLGTKPELGEVLLYTGGAIGIGGTIVLVNGFNKIAIKPKAP